MKHEEHFKHTDLTPASDPEQLALDILQFARNRLLIRLRFLEPAFLQLSLAPDPEGSFSTDGYFISYSFVHVIRRFQAAQENVSFDYLHVVMHCLFGHPFVGPAIDRIVWDTATDIAVCAAILALKLPYLKTDREERQTELIEALQADVPLLTAERLYHFFREIHCEPERLLTMRELFASDDHARWYTHAKTSTQEEAEKEPDPEKTEDSENSSEEDASGQNDPNADDEGETAPAGGGESAPVREDGDVSFEEANALSPSADETSAVWRDISGKVQTDLETTSGEYGQKASSILRSWVFCAASFAASPPLLSPRTKPIWKTPAARAAAAASAIATFTHCGSIAKYALPRRSRSSLPRASSRRLRASSRASRSSASRSAKATPSITAGYSLPPNTSPT